MGGEDLSEEVRIAFTKKSGTAECGALLKNWLKRVRCEFSFQHIQSPMTPDKIVFRLPDNQSYKFDIRETTRFSNTIGIAQTSHTLRSEISLLYRTLDSTKQPFNVSARFIKMDISDDTYDGAKNQMWNLMPMKSQIMHQAVHGLGPNALGPLGRLWFGTPTWFKTSIFSTGGRIADDLGE